MTKKKSLKGTSIPIRVLTQNNSLVSKESYRKAFDRSEAVFDMGTFLGSILKLKKNCVKNFQSSGVPIRLLTKKILQ